MAIVPKIISFNTPISTREVFCFRSNGLLIPTPKRKLISLHSQSTLFKNNYYFEIWKQSQCNFCLFVSLRSLFGRYPDIGMLTENRDKCVERCWTQLNGGTVERLWTWLCVTSDYVTNNLMTAGMKKAVPSRWYGMTVCPIFRNIANKKDLQFTYYKTFIKRERAKFHQRTKTTEVSV